MTDRHGRDGKAGRRGGDESGRIRANCLGPLCGRSVYTWVVTAEPLRVLALAIVVLGVAVTPLVAGGVPATAEATADETDPAPGPHLAGVVGAQDSEVRGTVAADRFGARLANASSDRERAAVIDERLTRAEGRLGTLEERLRELERAREDGSLEADAYAARLAALGAAADELAAAATASERAAARLPAERREALNAAERAAIVRNGANSIRDRASEATAAIDGSGEAVRADPVSLADVRVVAERAIRVPDSLRGVAGSERVNLHVRRANGTTAVYAVDIENGRVASVAGDSFEDPTLAVYTDYRVVGELRRADDPAAVVESAATNDRIRYDGQGLGNSLKYGLVRIASLFAS